MALARAFAVGLVGLKGHVVEVEADLAQGIPGLSVIGLPDAALAEARDRVRAAVVNSGHSWPSRRITLALSPAWLPKRGSGFDLALAASVLAADRVVPPLALLGRVLLGELGLDGRVRPVRGVLPAALTARDAGVERLVVPLENLAEARLVPGVTARGVGLAARPRRAADRRRLRRDRARWSPSGCRSRCPTWATSWGRSAVARRSRWRPRAVTTPCSLGPPGSGKTMLAERLPGLLPPLTREEALEVTAVHSVAGVLPEGEPLVELPPFQDPHHTATVASIVGGGSGIARPGAASLAHRGVLFLDEAPEFSARVLDALRQPLESGRLSITRVGGTATYPAAFSLLLAANPCPCAKPEGDCSCPPDTRRRYLARLSGPLLDRVDMHVEVPQITRAELLADAGHTETTQVVAARVRAARARALRRLSGTPWRTNGQVPAVELRRRWPVPRTATALGRHRPRARAADGARLRPGPAPGLDAGRPAGVRRAGPRARRPRARLPAAAPPSGGSRHERVATTTGSPGWRSPASPSRARVRCTGRSTEVGAPARLARAAHRPALPRAVARRAGGGGCPRRGLRPRGRPRPAARVRRAPARARRHRVARGPARLARRRAARRRAPRAVRTGAAPARAPSPPAPSRSWARGPPPPTACTSPASWPAALADRGVAVVSGGAYGIDAAAHGGALAADAAPTVAVLGLRRRRRLSAGQRPAARPPVRAGPGRLRAAAGQSARPAGASSSATGSSPR